MDKRSQLRDLCLIVCGIRVFNWHRGKAGEGVDDLPDVMSRAAEAAADRVEAGRICATDGANS